MSISQKHISYLTDYLRRESGLVLNESKLYLLRTRMLPLARDHGFEVLDDMVDAIRRNERGELAAKLIDAMTTNETLFFRDKYPFEALKNLIFPRFLEKGGSLSRIKIWSAASSTGQEAYSIAMTAVESVPQGDKRVKIVGSDISPSVIEYCKQGVYKQMEVQRGLPIQNLLKYFKQVDENTWQVNDQLKSMVHFQHANLISPSLITTLRAHAPFDVVFCRNVLIYFDVEKRKHVIDQLAHAMNVGGYLFTGAGEMVSGSSSKWEIERYENRPIWRLVSK